MAISAAEPSQVYPYQNPPILWRNKGNGRFTNVTSAPDRISRRFTWVAAWPAATSTVMATSTWSSFITTPPASVLWNESPRKGSYLIVKLQGRGANRDAIGTRVIAQVGTRGLLRTIDGGGSYLSTNDLRVHFGLGETTQVDRLEVHWPSGKVETRSNLKANTTIEWNEAE